MKKFNLILPFAIAFFVVSCDNSNRPETLDTVESPAETANSDEVDAFFRSEQNGIILTEAPSSPAFNDARLSLEEPQNLDALNPGKNRFVFGVSGFELGAQTPGAEHRECANSEQGQHIHWILNNEPYTAHYEPTIEKELQPGKHLLLAFLSRSYHESLKHNSAYLVKQLNVGKTPKGNDFDLNAPMLFYSRPKGEYKGNDIEKLLVDFYPVNVNLSPNGNKVRLIIDGTEFLLTKWAPYRVEGLTPGQHTFRIQLVDNAGLPIAGPFNDSGDRVITLTAGEDHAHH
jgi:hypothetical protein